MPRIFVIGGPNGAGKTTAATGSLPEILGCDEYVNADAIAKALSPFASERAAFKAGRLMLDKIHDLAAAGRDFAFETTMASRSFAPFLKRCKADGYEVRLVFLWLKSVGLAQSRVAKRVRSGGHGIPREVIRRRYRAGPQLPQSSMLRWPTSGSFTTIPISYRDSSSGPSPAKRWSCSSRKHGTKFCKSRNEAKLKI